MITMLIEQVFACRCELTIVKTTSVKRIVEVLLVNVTLELPVVGKPAHTTIYMTNKLPLLVNPLAVPRELVTTIAREGATIIRTIILDRLQMNGVHVNSETRLLNGLEIASI